MERICLSVPIEPVEFIVIDLSSEPFFGSLNAFLKAFLWDEMIVLSATSDQKPLYLLNVARKELWIVLV